jgi:hypothetical protein
MSSHSGYVRPKHLSLCVRLRCLESNTILKRSVCCLLTVASRGYPEATRNTEHNTQSKKRSNEAEDMNNYTNMINMN